MVTHALALDTNEFEHSAEIRIHRDERWAECSPDAGKRRGKPLPWNLLRHCRGRCRWKHSTSGTMAFFSGTGARAGNLAVVLQSGMVNRLGVILCGTPRGQDSISGGGRMPREKEWAQGPEPAGPPHSPVRLMLSPAAKRR